jgi:ketosteroid isomerase-like protein
MSDPHRDLITRFYAAFANRDGVAMAACYGDDARFTDPVFRLRGTEVGAMWRMLCSRGADLRVEASNLFTDSDSGSAEWQAWYTFSTTGRPVHNIVQSRFRFAGGLIVEQVDTFAFWRWSRQALGPLGSVLGWTPLVRNKVRANARVALDRFIASERKPA